jgi:hypothetical protein
VKIVVLDFTDAKVKIINNVPKESHIEDYEIYLYDTYGFRSSSIEYMVVPELEIETF